MSPLELIKLWVIECYYYHNVDHDRYIAPDKLFITIVYARGL